MIFLIFNRIASLFTLYVLPVLFEKGLLMKPVDCA